MSQTQILVVDDEPDIRQLVQEILQDEGYSVQVAADGESARLAYAQLKPDLVLLDIWMPDVDGITLLKEWSASGELESQVVIMSGHGTLETAVEATRLGAFDFIQKPLSLAKLLATVKKALETRPQHSSSKAAAQLALAIEPLGNSEPMQQLRAKARQAAGNQSPVLISGEAGSGRETLARYIFQQSDSNGSLQVLDHAQANDTQAREYLFGSVTNGQSIQGLLDKSTGGALYIPDLQKLSKEAQQLLENCLETGQFTATGEHKSKPLNCRILCGAGTHIAQAVKDGKFSDSLYFRLNVLPLSVPALRDRPEDVPELIRFFSDWFPNQDGLPYRQFSVSIQNRMRNHSWPGNVRELRNLIKRLLVLGREGEISMTEVEEALNKSSAGDNSEDSGTQTLFDLPLREAREKFEHDYLVYQLTKAGGSVGKLSDAVGMERTHLYRKLRSLGIDPKSVARNVGDS
jgi:DNA-binding NtrC family response regulator